MSADRAQDDLTLGWLNKRAAGKSWAAIARRTGLTAQEIEQECRDVMRADAKENPCFNSKDYW